MQMFKDLLTASFPMTCKGSCFSFVHTMWELLPPHYVTSTDVPVVAVLPLSDSRINNTSYQLRRVHSSADGGEVCTILSVSLFCQTHSLAIHIQLYCSSSFSLHVVELSPEKLSEILGFKNNYPLFMASTTLCITSISLLSQRSYKSLFYCI